MIEITFVLIAGFWIILSPTLIPYLALLFLFVQGLAPTVVNNSQLQLAGITLHPLDPAYAVAIIYALIYFFKNAANNAFRANNTPATRRTGTIILIYLFFFVGKAINAYFQGVPVDAILRFTMVNTQALYFFLPLVIYKDSRQYKKLLYFTIFLSLLFPLGQPFLIASDTTQRILKGQGTFRLGYGDASILLALGVLPFYCWERRRYLASLPLSGILMLAHRSAYLGIAFALMGQAYLRGKKIKTLFLMGLAGVVVIAMMALVSSLTHVDVVGKTLNRAGETFKATGTTTARADVIFIAMDELQKRPMTGLSYREAYHLRQQADKNVMAFNIMTPHNFVLNSIMQNGLIGTLLLFILIYRALLWARKLSRAERFNYQGSYLYGAIVFCLVFGLMNNTLEGVGYVFWFLCGSVFWFVNRQSTPAQS